MAAFVDWLGRFTPTRVGKSMPIEAGFARASVHPHACGEIGIDAADAELLQGSPPRVWGNPEEKDKVNYNRRFTPTRVGKSSLFS